MLRRAKRLRPIFSTLCDEYDHTDIKLDEDELRQIDYLTWIMQPVFGFILELSKAKDVTACASYL